MVRRLVAVGIVCAVLVICSSAAEADDFDPRIERSLFDQVNHERASRGLPELKWNDKLMQSARKHTQRMKSAHSLTHQANGEPVLLQRVAATGLRFNSSAENVAYATNPDDLHPGWMHSEGHRKNILNPQYNSIGIGVLKAGNVYYATQNFAHVTSEDNKATAENRLAKAVNQLRASKGMAPVRVIASAGLQTAICGMAKRDVLDSNLLPADRAARGTIAFTASEPEEMPRSLINVIASPSLTSLNVGSCYMATERYPGGTYWFGVVY
ncbi:MAG: Allergen V5/Tpx related protein [Candidatus Angelobacter sp.]|jgi:uncharacterized protein YkwD|nr:Allergen V5/Tpx related protein [Candidatus Angelobacter sp.]